MVCKCGDATCTCGGISGVSDEVLQKEVARRNQLWKRQEEGAEMRRSVFIKEYWPFRHLWTLTQFMPLLVVVYIAKIAPELMRIYHDRFTYTAVAVTCALIVLVQIKRSRVEREFEKRYPEDADILSCSYVDDEDE